MKLGSVLALVRRYEVCAGDVRYDLVEPQRDKDGETYAPLGVNR